MTTTKQSSYWARLAQAVWGAKAETTPTPAPTTTAASRRARRSTVAIRRSDLRGLDAEREQTDELTLV